MSSIEGQMVMKKVFKDRIAECIFRNAVASIQLGVEDYKMAMGRSDIGGKRIISSVRNLYAGVLLLFKSYLAQVSCDTGYSLLKKKRMPEFRDGQIVWVGDGKNTIDYAEIAETLKLMKVDMKRLKALRDYRNNIEHYFDSENLSLIAIESMLAETFMLSNEFMLSVLKLSHEEIEENLGSSTIKALLQSECVLDKARHEQGNAFSSLKWVDGGKEALENMICPYCGTPVLLLDAVTNSRCAEDATFKCRGCSKLFNYEDAVVTYASIVNEDLSNIPPGECGNGLQFFRCKQCEQETFNRKTGICINCGIRDNLECSCCGSKIEGWEYDLYYETGQCSNCHHKSVKED